MNPQAGARARVPVPERCGDSPTTPARGRERARLRCSPERWGRTKCILRELGRWRQGVKRGGPRLREPDGSQGMGPPPAEGLGKRWQGPHRGDPRLREPDGSQGMGPPQAGVMVAGVLGPAAPVKIPLRLLPLFLLRLPRDRLRVVASWKQGPPGPACASRRHGCQSGRPGWRSVRKGRLA